MPDPVSTESLNPEALQPLQANTRIKTLLGELDTDEEGQERLTPPGSIGVLDEQNLQGQWSVHFGDAWVNIGECDLRDSSQYEVLAPEPCEADSAPSAGPQG